VTGSGSPMRKRKRAAVLGIAFVAVCCAGARLWLRDPLSPLMNAAKGTRHRPTEARLAEFVYSERPSLSRGKQDEDIATMRMQHNASLLGDRFGESVKPHDLHRTGVAFLIRGRDGAVEKLREAIGRAPDEPRYWNDLAAALYTRAVTQSNPHDLAHALAAADRALRLAPGTADALFNRALILERLSLREHAAAAWGTYLAVDSTSPWAGEARQRAEALRESVRPAPKVATILRSTHGGDEATLAPVVAGDAGMARRVAETVLLANWGRAVGQGSTAEAEAWLADARTIGRLLQTRYGESMVADAVAAIDACPDRECRGDLAEAHRRYDDAKRARARRVVAKSLPELRAAAQLFRRRGSPMALVADYAATNCLEDASDPTAAAELERVRNMTPAAYPALRAQLDWLAGANAARTGRTATAFDFYVRALDAFSRIGDEASATQMRDSLAAIASLLGRRTEAWRLRVAANSAYAQSGAPGDLHRSLELAGRMEAVEEHWQEAASLFALAIAEPAKHGARTEVSAMLWRALALSRAGLSDEARWQLGEARRFAWSIADDVLRESALEDLTFADAIVLLSSDPARAATILDRYLASSERHARTFLHVDAYLARARAARAVGYANDAERFYRLAVKSVDEKRSAAHGRGIADAYFATATAASNELAGLLQSLSRPGDAFAALEHGRGRIVLERLSDASAVTPEPLDAGDVAAQLGHRTMLVSYLLLDDHLSIFMVSRRNGLHVTQRPAPKVDLERTVRQLRAAIETDDAEAADAAAERLYDVFVAPLHGAIDGADTLVIIPDPAMETMPFAALREPRGQRLIERFALTFAPSASVFVRATMRLPNETGSAIVFGNPALDAKRHPSLEPLPAAAREAGGVAKQYPGAVVRTGEAATATGFLALLPSAGTIHLATHAVTSSHDPMNSVLLLAPDGQRPGEVRANEIVRASCRAHVVVLAACQTSFPAETPSDIGTLSLAFLAAGARNVIGTLWNVDDEDGAAFSRLLHAELRAGTAPSEAVRRAQRELLRTRPLRAWSAFTVTGAGT
jgi:CHAT domain-containing protein